MIMNSLSHNSLVQEEEALVLSNWRRLINVWVNVSDHFSSQSTTDVLQWQLWIVG